MNVLIPFVIALVGVPQQQKSEKVFENPKLGLSMTHAPDWVFKKKKHSAEFTIPIEGGKSQFKVQIFEAEYRGEADRWAQIEASTATGLGKTVVKQWQEDYLGVPMLFTNTRYTNKAGFDLQELSGLLYTKTAVKFQFRMESPAGVFDEAQKLWRDALLTLRTADGTNPEKEDAAAVVPDVSAPKKPKKNEPKPEEPQPEDRVNKPASVIRLTTNDVDRTKLVMGKELQKVSVSGHEGTLHYLTGWTLKATAEGFDATRTGFEGTVHLEVAGVLDAPIAERAVLLASSRSLALFSKVNLRVDRSPRWSPAGQRIWQIQRDGLGTNGKPLTVLHTVGGFGDYYWMATYTSDTPTFVKNEKLLGELMDALAIEVKS